MMIRKVVSLALILAILSSINLSAYAVAQPSQTNDATVTVVNLSDSITTHEIDEIVSSTHACIKQKDGTVIPIESVVTIEDISEPSYYSNNTPDQKSYKVTVNATASDGVDKIVSNSGNKNNENVNATATLTLVWTDGPGLENVIKEVSGTIRVDKGRITSSYVDWGNGWETAVNWHREQLRDVPRFVFYPTMKVPCPKDMYTIIFANDFLSLTVIVSSSVFQ